jgi:uncharacterized membrane protein YccC
MNERTLVTGIVSVLAAAIIAGIGNTDVIFVIVSILFFGLCIAYAEGCERL